MGMQVRLVLYAASEDAARRVAAAAFAEIEHLDAIFSNYRPHSEISELAASAAEVRPASDELITVLARAQRLARLSDGAFDVTVGPLTELWRRAIEQGALPKPDDIAAARARSGHRRLSVDAAAGTVALELGMTLDLGGIAKGFVLDRALAVMVGQGIEAALVEAGGDLVVGAPPPGSDGWRIDVPHLGCRVDLERAALATSGDEFQFVEIDGVRYAHIVDPRSGLGLRDSRTVSIVATDGLTADGLATTLTVLTAARGRELIGEFPGARVVEAAPNSGADEAVCVSESRPARSR